MAVTKRERWTEAELLALRAGEHDYFDRKGAASLTNREALSKAVSAFANSGGGHLIIGVHDNGAIEGVAAMQGQTRTREWLEQIIAISVSPPLADFRVHEVEPAVGASNIPPDRVVLIVDIADSRLAPHQAEKPRNYFYRQAGRSEPAPHFYLETLRNRLVGPALRADFRGIEVRRSDSNERGRFVEGRLVFDVFNDGNVAAYRWAIVLESLAGPGSDDGVLKFRYEDFPYMGGRDGGISIDDTILPSLSRRDKERPIGFHVDTDGSPASTAAALSKLFVPGLMLNFRVVSEFSRGNTSQAQFADHIDIGKMVAAIHS